MKRLLAALGAFGWLTLLASCGGGGDGGGGGTTSAGVTFSPPVLTANVKAGTSATLNVVASVPDSSAINGSVYAAVVDSQQVLTGPVNLSALSARSYSATVFTSPTLAAGRHQGALQVLLCREPSCASQYPGSPVPLPYDLTITPAPLAAAADVRATATVARGGPAPAPSTVKVTIDKLAWTATTAADWLQVSGGSGTGSGSFSVAFDGNRPVGVYEAVVTVRTSDGQTVAVPFLMSVVPPQFQLTSGVPSFTAVNGEPIAAQPISFQLNNGVATSWTAASNAPWLLPTPLTGTTPAKMTLSIDPSRGSLASGSHDGQVVLSSTDVADKAIPVRLTLSKPVLSASQLAVTLGGVNGRDMSPQSVELGLNTSTAAWPWRVVQRPTWVADPGSGTVSQAGATMSLSPEILEMEPGSSSESVVVAARVNGDDVTLPLTVNFNRDQQRLLPSEWSVGLSASPAGTVLVRTLKVLDNFGGTLPWTAASDQPWLTATPSGDTGRTDLVLNASAGGLPADTISYANVTLTTTVRGVSPAVVRVALWKSATGLATTAVSARQYAEIAADPMRPLVYAHGAGTAIDVFNAHTGQQVATVPNVGGALGAMAVSPDGSRLYVLDTPTAKLVEVDLQTLTRTSARSVEGAVDRRTPLLVIRPNGVEVVIVGNGSAYVGAKRFDLPALRGGVLTATSDGRKVYRVETDYSPSGVSAYAVDYSAISGGVLLVTRFGAFDPVDVTSFGSDVAASPDGSGLYVGFGAPYRCISLDPATLAEIGKLPGGAAYISNVEVLRNGRIVCGIDGTGPSEVWVHGTNGAILSEHDFGIAGQPMKRQLVGTPDSLVVVALTGINYSTLKSSSMVFLPVGP